MTCNSLKSSSVVNDHFYNVVTGRIFEVEKAIRSRTVDIIIPIYNALALTKKCICSVLENSSNCRLILINDASTDSGIRSYLDSIQSIPEKSIELIIKHNDVNVGFLKTVNEAFRFTDGHFVVLNSDTEVPQDWLDRLFAPIFESPDRVASVTPFSNTALRWLGCNFPDSERDSEIFKNMDVSLLDSFFSKYSINTPIEIFSGVGFCMAFNSTVVSKIGLFDYDTFGRGFCEEVDWSLRASCAGYVNVLAPNLFVFHKYGASFDSIEKLTLQESNFIKLINIHPTYVERKKSINSNELAQPLIDTLAIIADAKTKGSELWLAVVGGEKSSLDTVQQYLYRAEDHCEVKGYLFISFYVNLKCLKFHFVTPVQERIIYLPFSAYKEMDQIFTFLSIDIVVIVESVVRTESSDALECLNSINNRSYLLRVLH